MIKKAIVKKVTIKDLETTLQQLELRIGILEKVIADLIDGHDIIELPLKKDGA
jgi:hypothetical protein